MKPPETPKFIADINVGRLARWLRIMGYDTLIFKGADDGDMLTVALAESRIVLTRDTQLVKRRLITTGQVKAILIKSGRVGEQLELVSETLHLSASARPFAICVECNEPLVQKRKEDVRDCVPEYVYKTQNEYRQCPSCRRIYWKGTHWQAMTRKLKKLEKG
jgi:hypothetical protein